MFTFSRGTFLLNPTNGDMSQATVTAVAVPTSAGQTQNGSATPAGVTAGAGDGRHNHFDAIVARCTGSPVGTLQLYGSDNGVNFDIPLGAAVSITAASTTCWDVVTGLHFYQVLYTKISGTGTLTVTFSAKGQGW